MDSDNEVQGLEPGGAKESMIIPISQEGLLEHEGIESPRLAFQEGFGESLPSSVRNHSDSL